MWLGGEHDSPNKKGGEVVKLTDKQKMFVAEYLIDLNATQAAIRAGYSAKNADSIGLQLLRKTQVQEALKAAMDKRAKRVELTAEQVLADIREIKERCMQKVPVMYYDKEDKEYKQETALVKHADGTVKEEGIWKFDAQSALKACELEGKHLKLFTDRVEVSGSVSRPYEGMSKEQVLAALEKAENGKL